MPSPSRPAEPAKPRPPKALELATVDEDDLRDEGTFTGLGFYDLELTGRSAKGAEFRQCRFNRTDLSGTAFVKVSLTDCLVERSNFANLHGDQSTLLRVAFRDSRLTCLQWLDGVLRDVTLRDCRIDLSAFRATKFAAVAFEDCNLAGADFTGADLTGATFTRCDLTGAQFSAATMTGTRLDQCDLSGVAGVTSLAGATVSTADLVTLSHTLAAALGITIADTPGAA
ncbi:pentapeptide repeat-containing protein [Dactylosporangium aurantiacum]|nr:pentapeptide repeat-containing protein [Dactylosporangium aurantiacum]MDG6109502.1 pentapeptide repeat-containing protein [Dactylosporangium aurantiacum]